jgi:hypothetical protein
MYETTNIKKMNTVLRCASFEILFFLVRCLRKVTISYILWASGDSEIVNISKEVHVD